MLATATWPRRVSRCPPLLARRLSVSSQGAVQGAVPSYLVVSQSSSREQFKVPSLLILSSLSLQAGSSSRCPPFLSCRLAVSSQGAVQGALPSDLVVSQFPARAQFKVPPLLILSSLGLQAGRNSRCLPFLSCRLAVSKQGAVQGALSSYLVVSQSPSRAQFKVPSLLILSLSLQPGHNSRCPPFLSCRLSVSSQGAIQGALPSYLVVSQSPSRALRNTGDGLETGVVDSGVACHSIV